MDYWMDLFKREYIDDTDLKQGMVFHAQLTDVEGEALVRYLNESQGQRGLYLLLPSELGIRGYKQITYTWDPMNRYSLLSITEVQNTVAACYAFLAGWEAAKHDNG